MRRRLVRVHLEGMDASLEGILVGVWRGHYVLRAGKLFERPDASVALDGNHVYVPKGRVVFMQELHQ